MFRNPGRCPRRWCGSQQGESHQGGAAPPSPAQLVGGRDGALVRTLRIPSLGSLESSRPPTGLPHSKGAPSVPSGSSLLERRCAAMLMTARSQQPAPVVAASARDAGPDQPGGIRCEFPGPATSTGHASFSGDPVFPGRVPIRHLTSPPQPCSVEVRGGLALLARPDVRRDEPLRSYRSDLGWEGAAGVPRSSHPSQLRTAPPLCEDRPLLIVMEVVPPRREDVADMTRGATSSHRGTGPVDLRSIARIRAHAALGGTGVLALPPGRPARPGRPGGPA